MPLISEPGVQQGPKTNPTGRGGMLGLLSQKLATGLGRRKKLQADQDAQSQQSLSSQAIGQANINRKQIPTGSML